MTQGMATTATSHLDGPFCVVVVVFLTPRDRSQFANPGQGQPKIVLFKTQASDARETWIWFPWVTGKRHSFWQIPSTFIYKYIDVCVTCVYSIFLRSAPSFTTGNIACGMETCLYNQSEFKGWTPWPDYQNTFRFSNHLIWPECFIPLEVSFVKNPILSQH